MSETNALATVPAQPPRPKREIRVVESSIALFDTGKFEHLQRIAVGMSQCGLIPEHLWGKSPEEGAANCLLVVNQAHRWDIDPFALAGETYVVKGRLGYQGKVIKAVIDARAGLEGGLKYRFNSKQGDDFAVVAYASYHQIPDEAKPLLIALAEKNDRSTLGDLEEMGVLAVRLDVGQGKTTNDVWRKDPEQKLIYSASVRWARRHRPDIILGIKSDDDTDAERDREVEQVPRAVLPSAGGLPALKEPTRTAEDNAPEVINPPKAEKKPRVPKPEKKVEPTPEPAAQEEQKQPEPATAEPEQAPEAEESTEELTEAQQVAASAKKAGYSEEEVVRMAIRMNLCPTTAKTLADIAPGKLQAILDDWTSALEALEQLRPKNK